MKIGKILLSHIEIKKQKEHRLSVNKNFRLSY